MTRILSHLLLVKGALVVLSVVLVSRLGLQPAQLHQRLVRVGGQAAAATVVQSVAVDQLLKVIALLNNDMPEHCT